jgi:hypothetical protein
MYGWSGPRNSSRVSGSRVNERNNTRLNRPRKSPKHSPTVPETPRGGRRRLGTGSWHRALIAVLCNGLHQPYLPLQAEKCHQYRYSMVETGLQAPAPPFAGLERSLRPAANSRSSANEMSHPKARVLLVEAGAETLLEGASKRPGLIARGRLSAGSLCTEGRLNHPWFQLRMIQCAAGVSFGSHVSRVIPENAYPKSHEPFGNAPRDRIPRPLTQFGNQTRERRFGLERRWPQPRRSALAMAFGRLPPERRADRRRSVKWARPCSGLRSSCRASTSSVNNPNGTGRSIARKSPKNSPTVPKTPRGRTRRLGAGGLAQSRAVRRLAPWLTPISHSQTRISNLRHERRGRTGAYWRRNGNLG